MSKTWGSPDTPSLTSLCIISGAYLWNCLDKSDPRGVRRGNSGGATERRPEMNLKAVHHLQTWTVSWYFLMTISELLPCDHLCINMPLDFTLVNPECALAVQCKFSLSDGQLLSVEVTEKKSHLLIFLSQMSTPSFRTMGVHCGAVISFPGLDQIKSRRWSVSVYLRWLFLKGVCFLS